MQRTLVPVIGTLAGALLIPAQANAAATTVVAGSCDSLTDGDAQGCLFNGNINGSTNLSADASFLNAQNAYNTFAAANALGGPITLNFLADTDGGLGAFGSYTGQNQISGTFTINPGFNVNFFAVKYSDQFTLYQYTGQTSFVTDGQHGLSHLVFFGSGAVPEPSTWAMMLLGFAGIGFVIRRLNPSIRNSPVRRT